MATISGAALEGVEPSVVSVSEAIYEAVYEAVIDG
jgi:hypothetical protein